MMYNYPGSEHRYQIINAINDEIVAFTSRPGFKKARISYVTANMASMVEIVLARARRLIQMCCLYATTTALVSRALERKAKAVPYRIIQI